MLSRGDLEEREMCVGAVGPGPGPPCPRRELAAIHSPRNTWGLLCTAHRLLDALGASLMFLPRKQNFACPNAML